MPPLTDDQVQVEMKKMVEFIRQEALEKYREIQLKADEDFFIEKAKAVKSEATHIEKMTCKRLAQAQVQFRVGEATHKNKARLKVLQERDTQLNLVIDATKERLLQIVNSPSYTALLEKLILQSLFSLSDGNVTIFCSQRDKQLVNNSVPKAASEFKKKTGAECTLNVVVSSQSTAFYYPSVESGGIVASCKSGRIIVDNTLSKRLELLAEQCLPTLKETFIGPCSSRRFFD